MDYPLTCKGHSSVSERLRRSDPGSWKVPITWNKHQARVEPTAYHTQSKLTIQTLYARDSWYFIFCLFYSIVFFVCPKVMSYHWHVFFCLLQGLIFVVDSNDRERIGEAREELMRMLSEDELRDAVLLIFANKQVSSSLAYSFQ